MKRLILAASLLAAACSPAATTSSTTEAPAAPQSLMEQAQAKPDMEQPVFAWQTLTAYQTAHPEAAPPCASIREARSMGVVPPDVAPGSVYQPYAGALVFSIQCGPQLTTVRPEAREHWLVVMAPGAADAVVVNCADGRGVDQCARTIPRAVPTPATTTSP